MLLIRDQHFASAPFESEDELEQVVLRNASYFFGDGAILLPKLLIRTTEGYGTIPDAYAIDLVNRRWFIVEVELSCHSVWNHIAPQVARQLISSNQPASRRALVEQVVSQVSTDKRVAEIFRTAGIADINIRRVVSDILDGPPIIGIPIDDISPDLRDWARTFSTPVRLWIVRKLVCIEDPMLVGYDFPDELLPTLDTTPRSSGSQASRSQREFSLTEESSEAGRTIYATSLRDLVASGALDSSRPLTLVYRGRQFQATVSADGSMTVSGRTVRSPSNAAAVCLQQAGSNSAVNGWIMWKDSSGRTLAEIRDHYDEQNKMAEEGRAANPHAFGTSGTSPAEQAWVSEANGDT